MVTVKISGTSYKNAKLSRFPVKPRETKKVGFGVQHIYELDDMQAETMFDLLANAACDTKSEAIQDALYGDLDRFPATKSTVKKASLVKD
jgi:hypothetical protein